MKRNLLKLCCLVLAGMAIVGCKKEKNAPPPVVATNLATLGLYKYASGTNKRIFIPITMIGTKSVSYLSVFDTGSSGMTIDATGILPASMITSSGIQVTGAGDTVVVNGITVTSQTGIMSYGDNNGLVNEYGNLAYAPVTIGDQNGNFAIKRIPIFLYYKVEDMTTGKTQPAHSNDVFGVGPGTSYAFSAIASPLSYLTLGVDQTSGFRLAALKNTDFTTSPFFVADLLTIGLTPADLNSSGFIMHPLTHGSVGGYSPDIPATVTYQGQSLSAQILFDTGTPSVTIIEKSNNLPDSTVVSITTNKGFTYTYTTMSTDNLTAVENPNETGDFRTIFSLDFFISNEFLTDYAHHEIGLKNN